MSNLLTLFAVILLGALFWDAFVTVFSSQGAGPITRWWTAAVWRMLLTIHERRSIHSILSLAGPLMLLGVVCVWYVLLGVGWWAFFYANDGAIIENFSRRHADYLEVFYFVGTTVSSVGYGDFLPNGFPWTVWSNIAGFSGTVLLTTALSYLLPIVAASFERQHLAQQIYRVGDSVPEFIEAAWSGRSPGSLDQYLLQLGSSIDKHAHKHLAYPILLYFHSSDLRNSPGKAMLLFADAIFLASNGLQEQARPPLPIVKLINSCLENYLHLATFQQMHSKQPEQDLPAAVSLQTLRELDLPVVDPQQFEDAVRNYAEQRRKLVALCREDGWPDT